VYTVGVDYPTAYSEISVTDTIPAGTTFVSANQKVTCDNGACNVASKTITWKATENKFVSPGSYTITLKATIDNKYVVNVIKGEATPGDTGTGTAAGYVAPNDNTCGGKYNLNNAIHKNFGDPSCDATPEKIMAMIKQKDPANAAFLTALIPCESSYNPNAYNPRARDPQGAWGLFQIGSSTPQGQAPPGTMRDGYDTFDRGDVNWQLQIDNAIKLYKDRGKGYWACG
jgi:hypothetical protein